MESTNNNLPDISGISPSEGPLGTKITIRGENLGESKQDLASVIVCGINCTKKAQWISPRKIVCTIHSLTLNAQVTGSIRVKTLSGGEAESDLQFTIKFDKLKPLTECAIWIEEETSQIVSDPFASLDVEVKEILCDPDPLGILPSGSLNSGPATFHENFAQYSSKLSDDSFNPIKFLLDRHSLTSYENIRKGTESLNKKLNITGFDSKTATTSASFSAQSSMVVDVIADMYKLAKVTSETRIVTKSDLTSIINQLETRIASYFSQLSLIYSRRVSLMRFIGIYNLNIKMFSLPKNIQLSSKYKSNYFDTLQQCIEFKQTNKENFKGIETIHKMIDVLIKDFINEVSVNFEVVFPIQIDVFLDFYYKIKNINTGEDYTHIILKTHTEWVKSKFIQAQKSLKSIKNFLEPPNLIQITNIDNFKRNLTLFLTNGVNFYKKEIEIDLQFLLKFCEENIKTKTSIPTIFLSMVDLIYNHIKWFLSILNEILLNYYLGKYGIILTSLPLNYQTEIFSAIFGVFQSVKSSNSEIQKFIPSDKQITFFSDVSMVYNSFIFDCFSALKKFKILQISISISKIPEKYSNSYFKSNFNEFSLSVYTTIYEFLKIFRDIFLHIYCSGNNKKIEDLFPDDFLTISFKDSFDLFMVNQDFHINSLVSFLDNMSSVIILLKSHLLVGKILEAGWDKSENPVDKNQIINRIKTDLSECEKFYQTRVLPKLSGYLVADLVSGIQDKYFSKRAGHENFYKKFLKLVLNIREMCITTNPVIYKSLLREICCNLSNLIRGHMKVEDTKMAARLYRNLRVIGIFYWYICGEKLDSYEETVKLFKESSNTPEIHVEKIIEKHKQTLNVLKIVK